MKSKTSNFESYSIHPLAVQCEGFSDFFFSGASKAAAILQPEVSNVATAAALKSFGNVSFYTEALYPPPSCLYRFSDTRYCRLYFLTMSSPKAIVCPGSGAHPRGFERFSGNRIIFDYATECL